MFVDRYYGNEWFLAEVTNELYYPEFLSMVLDVKNLTFQRKRVLQCKNNQTLVYAFGAYV